MGRMGELLYHSDGTPFSEPEVMARANAAWGRDDDEDEDGNGDKPKPRRKGGICTDPEKEAARRAKIGDALRKPKAKPSPSPVAEPARANVALALSDEEYQALQKVAQAERRPIGMQGEWIVIKWLTDEGYLGCEPPRQP